MIFASSAPIHSEPWPLAMVPQAIARAVFYIRQSRRVLIRNSRPESRVGMSHTKQRAEALRRRAAGETLTEIARSFNVSHMTIARLMA
jgi:DNA-binding CsgD family transcriptional regulator